MKKRGVISDKEELEKRVKDIAKGCKDLSSLKEKLIKGGIEVYARGNAVLTGAYLGKRRYRLSPTLGITKEHFKAMTLEEERLQKLRSKRNKERTKNKER